MQIDDATLCNFEHPSDQQYKVSVILDGVILVVLSNGIPN